MESAGVAVALLTERKRPERRTLARDKPATQVCYAHRVRGVVRLTRRPRPGGLCAYFCRSRLLNTSGVRKETHIEPVIAGMLQKLNFVVCLEARRRPRLAEVGVTRSNANASTVRSV